MSGKMTTAQVAAAFGVTARTVQLWADAGTLPCTRTMGGARRFDASLVQSKLKGNR